MKKIQYTDDMLPEHDFDYSKARSNRFAGVPDEKKIRLIVLNPDVAGFFNTSDAVNKIPRGIMVSMPDKYSEIMKTIQ